MIKVTRLNDSEFWVNADLIEFIEETPDTVISFVNSDKIVVKEAARSLVDAIVDYRRQIGTQLPPIVDRKEPSLTGYPQE